MNKIISGLLLSFGLLLGSSALPVRLYVVLDGQIRVLLLDINNSKVLLDTNVKQINKYHKVGDKWIAQVLMRDGKWGYVDSHGTWIIKPVLDKAKTFSRDNIARVIKGGKWGFIRPDGSFLLEPAFYDVRPFAHGLAPVQKDKGDDYHYIDIYGKKAFDGEYCAASMYADNGLAAVAECSSLPYFTIGKNGIHKSKINGKLKWGYIDTHGKWVIKPKYERANVFNQLGIAIVRDGKRGDSYIIDSKGHPIGNERFEYLWSFSDSGVAWAQKSNGKPYKGYIDTKGKHIWKASYHDFGGEHNGLLVKQRSGYRVYDPFGKLIIKERSIWAANFYDPDVTVALRRKWGILYKSGEFKPFPADVLAPLTDDRNYFIGFFDGIVAMIGKSRDIIYLDKFGNQKYKLAPDDNGTVSLLDANGKPIWSSNAKSINVKSFLAPGINEHFRDKSDYSAGIIETSQTLLSKKEQKYYIPNPLYREGTDPYDLNADIETLKKGAIKIVASAYVGEDDWGSYYFLSDHTYDAFTKYWKGISKQLDKKYGRPYLNKSDIKQWKIGDKVLTLSWNNDSGDGDFYHQIILEVNTPKQGE